MPFVADEFSGRRFGKYEVLCRLAVGGMAEIFLAFPLAGPFAFRPVVLKRILSDHREDPSSLQMLIDEAKLTAQLSHKNVAQVLDLEVAGEDVMLVIELIQGANLEEMVEATQARKELLPLGFVVSAIRDAAQGLQHAHMHKDAKGVPMPIIHRDVTPRNIMVGFDGLTKVLDFGIARAVGSSRRTVAGMVRGTAAYMSPEQAIDAKVDTRSDIFSLGTIFHELLTGQRLFSRGNPGKEMAAVYEAEIPMPSVANKRVPKALDAVVLRALERSVSRRYQTPLELIRDIGLAAGSTAWASDRCGQLIGELFDSRQRELIVMLERIPDEGPGVSTDVGRERLADGEGDSEVRTVVGMTPTAPPTTTIPMAPQPSPKPRVQPAPRKSPMRPTGRESDPAAATKFFTPDFAPDRKREGDRGTDEAPVPSSLRPQMPTMVTSPGVPGPMITGRGGTDPSLDSSNEPSSDPGIEPRTDSGPDTSPGIPTGQPPLSGRRHLTYDTQTQPGPPARGTRTALLLFGALGAMVLGAAGGVLVYRSMAPVPKVSAAVGRISVATDRPAEVKMGDTVMKAPFADVWLSTGHQVLEVREVGSDGPWQKVEVDVSPDKVTRLEIKLDSLPTAP